ncbi:hypothetical protein EDC96DRAFT_28886 [Choanephora cucurbitarum]|nr:hypothetical protein EDC96DRAFT_28886 [Choanephora cucurbitarum]
MKHQMGPFNKNIRTQDDKYLLVQEEAISMNSSISGTLEDTQEQKPTLKKRFLAFWRIARPLCIMFVFDIGLPLVIFYILRIWLSIVIALIISGVPALLRVIYVFWKRRQVELLGCLFVVTFIISGVLSVVNDDARFSLFRESISTAIIGFAFLITLIPIKTRWFRFRPFFFSIYQQMMVDQPAVEWTDANGERKSVLNEEWLWTYYRSYRRYCYIASAIWGVAMTGEFIAKIIMIQSSLTIDQIIMIGNIAFNLLIVVLLILTAVSMYYMTQRGSVELKQWLIKNDYTFK